MKAVVSPLRGFGRGRGSVPNRTSAIMETPIIAIRVQRREGCPMTRNPTSISALWLFLLSSLAKRNGLLAISFRRRK